MLRSINCSPPGNGKLRARDRPSEGRDHEEDGDQRHHEGDREEARSHHGKGQTICCFLAAASQRIASSSICPFFFFLLRVFKIRHNRSNKHPENQRRGVLGQEKANGQVRYVLRGCLEVKTASKKLSEKIWMVSQSSINEFKLPFPTSQPHLY